MPTNELIAAHTLSNAAESGFLNGGQNDCIKTTTSAVPLGLIIGAHTLDFLCSHHTRIMRIYLFRHCAVVEGDELMEEVVACGVVIESSLIVREVVLKGRTRGFLDLRDRSCSRGGSERWVLVGGEERRKEMNARLMS